MAFLASKAGKRPENIATKQLYVKTGLAYWQVSMLTAMFFA